MLRSRPSATALGLLIVLSLLVTACGQAALAEHPPEGMGERHLVAEREVKATATNPPPTVVPSVTPPPPTATRVPPTATPRPTATVRPSPTATLQPGPGDVVFDSATQDCSWVTIGVNSKTGTVASDFTFDDTGDRQYIEVPTAYTGVYALCTDPRLPADVQIDADVETLTGPNLNLISLSCRLNDDGWYEAAMNSGGYWLLYRISNHGASKMLGMGASTAIHLQKARNHLTLVCDGPAISFYINGVKMGSANDRQFAEGGMAISVATLDIKGAGASFEDLTVRIPDPDNPPG